MKNSLYWWVLCCQPNINSYFLTIFYFNLIYWRQQTRIFSIALSCKPLIDARDYFPSCRYTCVYMFVYTYMYIQIILQILAQIANLTYFNWQNWYSVKQCQVYMHKKIEIFACMRWFEWEWDFSALTHSSSSGLCCPTLKSSLLSIYGEPILCLCREGIGTCRGHFLIWAKCIIYHTCLLSCKNLRSLSSRKIWTLEWYQVLLELRQQWSVHNNYWVHLWAAF